MAKSPYVHNVGTSAKPYAAGNAHIFSRHYYRHHGTSGDVRGEYKDLEFTSTGSGETVRLRGIANGTGVAAGGTINALHATGRVAAAKTVSGALNAIRATLEVAGTTPSPGGTLSAIQIDSNIVTGATLPSTTAFIHFDNIGATEIPNLFYIGTATSATGNMYYGNTLKVNIGGTTKYLVLSDAENSLSMDVSATYKDDSYLKFGDSDDVTMEWDTAATPDQFIMLPAANNTIWAIGNGTNSFDVEIFGSAAANYILWDASDNALEFTGTAVIDFDGATCNGSDTDGMLIKGGSSSTPIVEDTAASRFVSLYTDCGATSGSSYNTRLAHYLTGAGGSGAAVRAYCNVKGVAAAAAYGVEATAEIDDTASSSITGLGAGVRAIFAIQNTNAGTNAAIDLVYDVITAKSARAGGKSSFIRLSNIGAGTGCNVAIRIPNAVSADSTSLFVATADKNQTHALRCESEDGTVYWVMATTNAPS